MDDFELFSSYQLTHEENGSGNPKTPEGGCLSGCATIFAIGMLIFIYIIIVLIF